MHKDFPALFLCFCTSRRRLNEQFQSDNKNITLHSKKKTYFSLFRFIVILNYRNRVRTVHAQRCEHRSHSNTFFLLRNIFVVDNEEKRGKFFVFIRFDFRFLKIRE